MNDTENKIAEIYQKMMLSVSPQNRLKMAAEMFSDCRRIVLNSLQQENTPEKDIRIKLFQRFYACDFSKSDCEKILSYLQSR